MRTITAKKCILIFVVLFALQVTGCGKGKYETLIKTGRGEVTILKNGNYIIKLRGKVTTLKNVRTLLWFAENPYFQLADGRILRWDEKISDNAFGLQKIGDKMYFLKQQGSGPAWEGTLLCVVDEKEDIKELKIQKGDKLVNAEDYGVFDNRYIVNDLSKGFCVTDKNGQIVSCYPWPVSQ